MLRRGSRSTSYDRSLAKSAHPPHTCNRAHTAILALYLKCRKGVLEVPDVKHRQLQLDVAVVSRTVHQQLAEDRSEDRSQTIKPETRARRKENMGDRRAPQKIKQACFKTKIGGVRVEP